MDTDPGGGHTLQDVREKVARIRDEGVARNGAVLVRGTDDLIQYGAGIALPIAALGLFIGMRVWSTKISKESASEEGRKSKITPEPVSQETVED
jgi:hypothetical protein